MNFSPSPKVIKLFLCSTQRSMKFQLLIKTKMLKNKGFSCFKTLKSCIYHAYKCFKMQTIVGIFNIYEHDQFHARLSWAAKRFITSGPDAQHFLREKRFRVCTGLKSTWIYRTVLKSPWKWTLPWKTLKGIEKSLNVIICKRIQHCFLEA